MVHFCSLPLIFDVRQHIFSRTPSQFYGCLPLSSCFIPLSALAYHFDCPCVLKHCKVQALDFYILFAAREYTVFLADPVTILLTPSVQQQLHLTKALPYTISTVLVFSNTERCRSSVFTSSSPLEKHDFSGGPCHNFIDTPCPTVASPH